MATSPTLPPGRTLLRHAGAVALELTDIADIEIYAHDPWAAGPGLAIPFGVSYGRVAIRLGTISAPSSSCSSPPGCAPG